MVFGFVLRAQLAQNELNGRIIKMIRSKRYRLPKSMTWGSGKRENGLEYIDSGILQHIRQ